MEGKNLEEQYLDKVDQISEIDREIIGSKNRQDILALIKQRKPLYHEMELLYDQIARDWE